MAYASLQEIQKVSIEMLADFHAFCKEHQIVYFLTKGSLLGAIRHKGFIPWDDDVDVDMHVDDIEKLISCWELYGDKEKYFLQTKQKDINLPGPFIRIRKNNTTAIDEEFKHVPMNWGLPIDIFPVYNYPQSKWRGKNMQLYSAIAKRTSSVPFYHYGLPRFIRDLTVKICIIALKRMKTISDEAKDSPVLYYPVHPRVEGAARFIPRDVYYPPKPIQFEHVELSGMNKPESFLELEFGDYMTPPPKEQRKTHGSLVDLENDYSKYIQ